MADDVSIGKLISVLHRKSHVYFQKELRPLGMDRGQVKILTYLAHYPGATQGDLTDYFQMDKGTISYFIKRMEKSGYVKKTPNPNDLRIRKLYLTKTGAEKEKLIRNIFSNWTELLLNNFSDEERVQAFQILRRMVKNVGFLNENDHAEEK
ncbi:MarR family winged helix-turn-helix transcriptional regulator [Parapedobacter tibetensis]|uniref:MarR family winged helix-turn-helix transcriptional regulator n=1 Tax=Parapedobacter tibetensis TaxID=2972951 RepID=UPI00214DA8EB|nr:MarR family transcriptional regulator [Parapedobacter tibetensis]